jgi:hypothetical protein
MSKKILVVPFILLAVGCRDRYEGQAGAASSPSPSPYGDAAGSYASPGTMSGSTGDIGGSITATVVSVDESGRTITVRDVSSASGSQGQRLNVSSTAVSSLSGLHAGDTVTITCDSTGSMGAGSGMTGTGTTGTGTTGTGTTGTGTTGTGTTGGTYAGSGSLANCTNVTMITRSTGATGR